MSLVMVVDNHPLMLKFMAGLLEKRGYDVVTAPDGLSALELIETHRPDVFFIDLVMPNIGGEKLVRIIQSRREFSDSFIVVMSAVAKEEKHHLDSCSADVIIAKGPFDKFSAHVLRVMQEIEAGRMSGLRGMVLGCEEMYEREITKELLASKKHYEITLNNISEGFMELMAETRIVFANEAALAILGFGEEELLSSDFMALFSEADQERIAGALKHAEDDRRPGELEGPITTNDKLVKLKFIPLRDENQCSMVVILRDVTHEVQLETQLQRAQKMEAIGTLAGGVAHDLNNILSGIVSYPDLLLMQLPDDSDMRRPLTTMRESGKKAVAIVQDLLTLARRGLGEVSVISLNDVICRYMNSPEFQKLKSYHPWVHIESRLHADLLNILGSSIHLHKTLMNLVSNAAEAIEKKGEVIIETGNCYVDKPIKGYDTVNEGEYVLLRVSDTGVGMAPEEIERIFEPFYTKKMMNRSGTGLGMAVVWGTVKDHKGYIDVESREKRGTTVTLYFPVTRRSRGEESVLPIEEYMGSGETLLVVDDVKEQREIISSMLKALGYRVEAVPSGEEAIASVKEKPYALVILDMVMEPGIDGLDTYIRILKKVPGQKAIIVSGFSETERITEALRLGAGAYLKKPYTMDKLGQAVKKGLGR
jgi:PAS domain S-box-containing protein